MAQSFIRGILGDEEDNLEVEASDAAAGVEAFTQQARSRVSVRTITWHARRLLSSARALQPFRRSVSESNIRCMSWLSLGTGQPVT